MRRREFLIAAGGFSIWPRAARADQRISRIGWLNPARASAGEALERAFRDGLRDFGYVDGETIAIEALNSDGDIARLPGEAKELIDSNVDLIVSAGPGAYAAHMVTKTVPIVAVATADFIGIGLAENLDHPGGNVTGVTFSIPEETVKRVALLKQAKPAASRIGFLVPKDYRSLARYLEVMDAPIKALGVELTPIEAAGAEDSERALSAASAIDGLVIAEAPMFNLAPGPAIVAGAATGRGLPSAGAIPIARAGGLIGYSVEFAPMFRRAAYFVDRILKGEKPEDIPIEQATKFRTLVNQKTAKSLGLDVPQSLLAAADEVIE